MSVLVVLVMRVGQVSFRVYGRNLLMISWLLAVTFLTYAWRQPIALPGGIDGFTEGGIAVGKLSIMLGWVTILGRSSSPLELVSAIEWLCLPLRRIGAPVQKFSLVAMLSMRFLPLLFDEGQHLLHAYLARGFEWNNSSLTVRIKHVGAFFLPLFSHLLRRVEHLTLAMENKAFQLDEERTSLYVLKMKRVDYGVLCACLPVLFCGYVT
jgi:energy-coupling factor transport system permease protein